jgi:hypothetical protein
MKKVCHKNFQPKIIERNFINIINDVIFALINV